MPGEACAWPVRIEAGAIVRDEVRLSGCAGGSNRVVPVSNRPHGAFVVASGGFRAGHRLRRATQAEQTADMLADAITRNGARTGAVPAQVSVLLSLQRDLIGDAAACHFPGQ